MSKIDEQIKVLMEKKRKIELYDSGLKALNDFSSKLSKDDKALFEDIKNDFKALVADNTAKLEGVKLVETTEAPRSNLIARLDAQDAENGIVKVVQPPKMTTREQAEFSKKYAYLGHRKVEVKLPNGEKDNGLVVNIHPPHFVILLDKSQKLDAFELESLTLLEK